MDTLRAIIIKDNAGKPLYVIITNEYTVQYILHNYVKQFGDEKVSATEKYINKTEAMNYAENGAKVKFL
jgi:hypothetical protein